MTSTPPPQQSGVSGDGREALREQVYAILAKAYYNGRTDTVAHAPGGTLEGESNQHAVTTVNFQTDDLMRLIDAQYNAGLEAAEEHLPDKQPEIDRVQHYCFNAAIDAARQQIRALRRGAE
jgi:hypothetical protein